jgi:hypothetical protein
LSESNGLVFRLAEEDWEFEQVHRLNYRTFVEEIPQHERNERQILVDRLLAQSACYVAVRDRTIVGMITISAERPFSLDRKLPDLDELLPADAGVLCEVRLLAIEPGERRGPVFGGLMGCIIRHCEDHGYQTGLISAHPSQMRLYRHLGFHAFGPQLGTADVPFQGMYVTWHTLAESMPRIAADGRATQEERQAH